MQLLYNSDNFVVVQFDMPAAAGPASGTAAGAGAATAIAPALQRGGYEIVDKFAGKEIFIEGALADRFQRGVQALVKAGPDAEAIDDFIAGWTALAQQPVALH